MPLGLFPLSEAIAWTTIFPYIYAMVQSLSLEGKDDKNLATYAGLMVAAFTLGESIGATIWARISDAIGRKPTLIIGCGSRFLSASVNVLYVRLR